ncbi:O-antigen ligase family protein [Nocardioides sp. GY 10113]|uniref:O-antigen ligase family protein n=1 Tax=Nocardioides sp. GY 10113 TaxID=2569761 RepID=UPI0010A7D360|nr:O-antigen ligase family protein [Nocardioides sp. GY 10113]TIC79532.1 O-antigen ligase family protein [Nocardioides sp. GY 10113]
MTLAGAAHGVPTGLRARFRPDATTILIVYTALLLLIPSDQRVGPLGGAGGPASIIGLLAGVYWCWMRLSLARTPDLPPAQPVKVAAFVFVAAVLASFPVAMLRPLAGSEASQADLGVLRILSAGGVLLLAHDGIATRTRFRALVGWLVGLGVVQALLGLVQFLTHSDVIGSLTVPGLVKSQTFAGVVERGGFLRPAGGAMSPLEYGLVLSMIVPLAITVALFERRGTGGWRRSIPALLMASACLISGSRSAIAGLAVVMIVLFPAWSWAIRRRMAVVGLAGLVGVYLLVPGMIGTLRYLFTESENDPSAASRTGSYGIAELFIGRSPWLGRGFGTFLPQYRILDNEYLLLTIETGLIGLFSFLALVVVAATCGVLGRKREPDEYLAQTGQALAASILAGAVLLAFFDGFSFPMAFGLVFLVIGMAGAYFRLVRGDD